MSKPQKYFLVSLPTSISPSNDKEEAFQALRSTISTDSATTYPFTVPSFKIGTLDALVQQADDLAKLEGACEGVVAKVADSLRNILEGDEEKIAQQKTVNDKPVENYLASFHWNKVKYRADKPISELLDALQKQRRQIQIQPIQQHQDLARRLAALPNRQPLAALAHLGREPQNLLAPDASEYLQQHLIAVPNAAVKEWLKTYESLSPMVVPRSSTELARDDEFTLYAVTVFKKHGAEFVHRCREKRWTPREWKFTAGGRDAEEQENQKLEAEERRVWGEALRLGRTGYSDAVMAWVHVLALRVFVETVLRYGLPLSFVCGMVKVTAHGAKKAKQNLDANYSHLGGNAFGRDKKGKVTKDDSAVVGDMQAAGHGGEDYNAYVFYEFDIV
ncbi:Vacuolar ATP synthase subunit C [Taxawa tesnikishii (nom. ined.)]|nr:Vacuolar ATP synthase subunit C [Dothideales sp. JES 119]